MSNPVRYVLSIALCLFFTGCLTIEENYVFKKDGSGTMEYVVDLSELGEMMKSFDALNEEKDKSNSSMNEIGAMDMTDEAEALKKIEGIGKVKVDTKKEWVQRISFRFKDLTALNAALNVLMPDSAAQTTTFFKWEGNDLVRINNNHAYELGAGMAESANEDEAEEDEGSDLNMSAMLESMKYKYSFKFAQPMGDLSLADGVTSERTSAKEVHMETDFAVIGKNRNALDLKIPVIK